MKTKLLIIAPHPDDEVLGCAGTILRFISQGCVAHLCIVTKAYTPDWSKEFLEKRPKEIKKANKILGIKNTYFLDFPTAKLDTVPQKDLIKRIAGIVNRVKPDILFFPHKGDLNRDHRLTFESTLVAVRPLDSAVKRILSYETLSETGYGQVIKSFVPNIYIDITQSFRKKVEAMKAYGSELRQYPHPRSIEGIELLARKRGCEIGIQFAEAFILVREIMR